MKKVFSMKGKTIKEIEDFYNKIFNYFTKSERVFSVSMRMFCNNSYVNKFVNKFWGFFRSYDGLIDFYKGENFIGTSANSVGPYGKSNIWMYNEDGNAISTEPDPQNTIFVDGCYDVIVIR